MADFYEVFLKDRERLQDAVSNNPTDRDHISRCKVLAASVDWDSVDAGHEFRQMLGPTGLQTFNAVLERTKRRATSQTISELRDPKALLIQLMHVHDLGKSEGGVGHEQRSAEIILRSRQSLAWSPIGTQLLHGLVLNHGLMGITRTGEASVAFLVPLLRSVCDLPADVAGIFLDLLILLTCCDSGATVDPSTKQYYLDDSRVKLYNQVAHDLLQASRQHNPFGALLQKAAGLEQC